MPLSLTWQGISDKIPVDKSAENMACCRKFRPPKSFVRLKFIRGKKKKSIKFLSVNKTARISSWCRIFFHQRFFPPKNFVRQNFFRLGTFSRVFSVLAMKYSREIKKYDLSVVYVIQVIQAEES